MDGGIERSIGRGASHHPIIVEIYFINLKAEVMELSQQIHENLVAFRTDRNISSIFGVDLKTFLADPFIASLTLLSCLAISMIVTNMHHLQF